MRARLHAREIQLAEQLADCPFVHGHLVTYGNFRAEVNTSPANDTVALAVGPREDQLPQLL